MIWEATRKNQIQILQVLPVAVQVQDQVRTQIHPVQVRRRHLRHQVVVEVVQVQARKRRRKLRKSIENKFFD